MIPACHETNCCLASCVIAGSAIGVGDGEGVGCALAASASTSMTSAHPRANLVCDKRNDLGAGESLAPVERCEFDKEGERFDLGSEPFEQTTRGGGGPPGSEKIVDDKTLLPRPQRA